MKGKYILLILLSIFLILPGIVSAITNLDFRIEVEDKIYFPNETIPVNVSVQNRDVSFDANDVVVSMRIGKRTFDYEFGDIKSQKSVIEDLTLPEYPPGDYMIKGELNFTDFFGEIETIEIFNSFHVRFPEIERLPRNIVIKDFTIPEEMISGETHTVSIKVSNEGTIGGDLLIELSSMGVSKSKKIHLDAGETETVNLDVEFYNPGVSKVEGKVYGLVGDEKYLLAYDVTDVFVKESNVAKLSFERTELVNEANNQINQNDIVKLKIYLKNSGNWMASNVKGTLSSSVSGLEVTNSEGDFGLITKNGFSNSIFEIKTDDVAAGSNTLNLVVSYTDGLGEHSISIEIPITVSEGSECQSNNDCPEDQICDNYRCVVIPCECGEIVNHQCIKYDCCSSSDCPKGSICDISSHTCIQCIDEHCCPTGKVWCEQKGECLKPTDCVGCPNDTPCKSGWPTHEGKTFWINEKLYACDMFETCHPDLQYIAKEAAECCESGCKSSNCHKYCSQAYEYSDLTSGLTADRFKKCAGLYLIYGLGPTAKYMQEYYNPEIECRNGYDESVDCGRYGFIVYSENAQKLKCQPAVGQPDGWASNTDMTKNSCLFSDLPAHVNMEILSTGTCVDYSTSLTTLLRMVGYSTNEVYSLNGPGHEFNLVKFPGEIKWNLVDTVGNNPSSYNPVDVPGKWYPYCKYNIGSCANDAGEVRCPAKTMVKGCS